MSPLAPIAHLVALAIGIWAGFAIMGAIGTPDLDSRPGGPVEVIEVQQEIADCKASVDSPQGMPPRLRQTIDRLCEEEEGRGNRPARSFCLYAAMDATPVGELRTHAVAACETIPEDR